MRRNAQKNTTSDQPLINKRKAVMTKEQTFEFVKEQHALGLTYDDIAVILTERKVPVFVNKYVTDVPWGNAKVSKFMKDNGYEGIKHKNFKPGQKNTAAVSPKKPRLKRAGQASDDILARILECDLSTEDKINLMRLLSK
jgi:hypothetical protein